MKSFLLLVLISFTVFSAVTRDDKPIALTEKQRAESVQFGQVETQLNQALQGLIGQSAGLAVNCQNSMQVHAGLKEILSAVELNRARRDKWLAELRLEHSCVGCTIEDGKLVRPETVKLPQTQY